MAGLSILGRAFKRREKLPARAKAEYRPTQRKEQRPHRLVGLSRYATHGPNRDPHRHESAAKRFHPEHRRASKARRSVDAETGPTPLSRS